MASTGTGLYHPRKGNYNNMVKCDAPSPDKCRVEGGAIHVKALTAADLSVIIYSILNVCQEILV